MAGLYGLRVADQVRIELGNDEVGALYTAMGEFIHREGRRIGDHGRAGRRLCRDCSRQLTCLRVWLTLRSTSRTTTTSAARPSWSFERTGKDVGTPIITFHPGQPDEASFFGPVISSIPRGAAALKLWDAIEIVATTSGMAELKRSNRSKPVFD